MITNVSGGSTFMTQIDLLYPSSVTLRKQKSKAMFKTLTEMGFVALFSTMINILVAFCETLSLQGFQIII